MITSRINEGYIDSWPNPNQYRLAHDWLVIEREHKDKKWFIKSMIDKGKVLVIDEDKESFFAYETEFEITYDRAESRPFVFDYEVAPKYIRILKGETHKNLAPEGVPCKLLQLYSELYSRVGFIE